MESANLLNVIMNPESLMKYDKAFYIARQETSNEDKNNWEIILDIDPFEEYEDANNFMFDKDKMQSAFDNTMFYAVIKIENRIFEDGETLQYWSYCSGMLSFISITPGYIHRELQSFNNKTIEDLILFEEWVEVAVDLMEEYEEDGVAEMTNDELLSLVLKKIIHAKNMATSFSESAAYLFADFVHMIEFEHHKELMGLISAGADQLESTEEETPFRKIVEKLAWIFSRDQWIERGWIAKRMLQNVGLDNKQILQLIQSYRIDAYRSVNEPIRVWGSVVELSNNGDWTILLPPNLVPDEFTSEYDYVTHLGEKCLKLTISTKDNSASKKVTSYVNDLFNLSEANKIKGGKSLLDSEKYPKVTFVTAPYIVPEEDVEFNEWQIAE